MTPAEVAALFAIDAGFSNRKPDETGETAKLWARVLCDVSWADATEALAGHYRDSDEWLMPKHILDRVKRIRAKRIADHPPLVPPPGLSDAEERAWLATARRRIGDGEVIDCDAAYELVAGSVRELLAAATPPTTDEAARSRDTTPKPPLPRTKEVPQ